MSTKNIGRLTPCHCASMQPTDAWAKRVCWKICVDKHEQYGPSESALAKLQQWYFVQSRKDEIYHDTTMSTS